MAKAGFLGTTHPHTAGRMSACRAISLDTTEIALDDLHDPNIGLVIIEGKNTECTEYAIAAANAGKPILIEKPGAENAERCRLVAETVNDRGIFCQVGYHLRYSPSVQRALAIIKSGKLGRITTGRFHAAVMQPWLTDEWFCDPNDMGGLVFLDFCHMLDLLALFLGMPSGFDARILKLSGVPEHIFEDSAAFTLQFGDVLVAGDVCGWEANDWITTWDIELYGTEGTMKLGIHPPWLKVYTPQSGWETWEDPTFDGEQNYAYEIQDILTALPNGKPNLGCDIERAAQITETISEMYRCRQH